MSMPFSHELRDVEDLLKGQRRREVRLRRALHRILSAAEGDPRFPAMNWSDVADVARTALAEVEGARSGESRTVRNGRA